MPVDQTKENTYSHKEKGFVYKNERGGIDYERFATREWALLLSFFRWYPDIMEDLACGDHPDFHNSLINRVMKRYMARYEETFTAATRGLGKTTCIVSDKCNKGILWPGEITGYYAPVEKQAAPLASKAFATYQRNTPLLADHWIKNSDAETHFKATTKNGSKFIMSIDRGMDTSGVVAEECAQEDKNPFDFAEFNQVVLGTNRLTHKVNGEDDPTHIDSQIHYITSATRKENEAFSVYMEKRRAMAKGDSAFAICIPWQVPVLLRMKSYSYYMMLKKNLTTTQFMRECETKWTGSIDNPIVRSDVVMASRKVKVMEDKHCGNPDVFYIIGYDVSSRDRAGNAMTATAVIKCERQFASEKRDEYIKSLVYLEEARPPVSQRAHAAIIKRLWRRFSLDGGRPTYIVIDARSYGQGVVEIMHSDLGDGLPPMCTMNYDPSFAELVQDNAVPCIYPMIAQGTSGQDPNSIMLDYIERSFENGNLRLLTANLYEGLQSYKLANNIKDDDADAYIQRPYSATNRLCQQIANLKKQYGKVGWTEVAVNAYIQKDMWSALLYGCRLAQRLEKSELYAENRRKNAWEEFAKAYTHEQHDYQQPTGRKRSVRIMGRGAIKQ